MERAEKFQIKDRVELGENTSIEETVEIGQLEGECWTQCCWKVRQSLYPTAESGVAKGKEKERYKGGIVQVWRNVKKLVGGRGGDCSSKVLN